MAAICPVGVVLVEDGVYTEIGRQLEQKYLSNPVFGGVDTNRSGFAYEQDQAGLDKDKILKLLRDERKRRKTARREQAGRTTQPNQG